MREILEQFVAWTKLKFRLHTAPNRIVYFKEREIWWASLGVNIGTEQNGKNETFERPVLVLKKFNLDLLWILPMTSQAKEGKFYFATEYDREKSFIILSQIRTISQKRLLRKVRTLPMSEFVSVREAVKQFL